MDFEEYVAARRGRLVDHAVDLGVEPESAPDLADDVLAAHRRRIERLADPDVELYAAVERAVDVAQHGPRPPPRATRLAGAGLALVVVVALIAGGVWWLRRPPEQVRVPSFVGLARSEVADRLESAGLSGGVDAVPSCEPRGLVVGTDPPAGTQVDVGSSVRLLSAAATARDCGDRQERQDRAAAWAFLGFVNGGPAPVFDDTVYVVLDGREPAVLPAAAAADPQRWAGIRVVARQVATLSQTAAYPRLQVTTGRPPARQCGIPRPRAAGPRETLRLQVQPGGGADVDCPLTVDLYRDQSGVIDAVVVYSAGKGRQEFLTPCAECDLQGFPVLPGQRPEQS